MLERVVLGLRMRILFEEFFCWTRYLSPGALRSAREDFGSVSRRRLQERCELASSTLWMLETEEERKSMQSNSLCKRA